MDFNLHDINVCAKYVHVRTRASNERQRQRRAFVTVELLGADLPSSIGDDTINVPEQTSL